MSTRDEEIARENAELRRRADMLERQVAEIERGRTRDDIDALAAMQARADAVAVHFGERAPMPGLGERPTAYRMRLLRQFQRHSPAFKGVHLDAADPAIIDAAELRVYADAETAARNAGASSGRLTPITETDGSGRKITRYVGDIGEFMRPFVSSGIRGRLAIEEG